MLQLFADFRQGRFVEDKELVFSWKINLLNTLQHIYHTQNCVVQLEPFQSSSLHI